MVRLVELREAGSLTTEHVRLATVVQHPWSGLLQRAEDYLRHLAHRPGVNPTVAARLQNVLAEWDESAGADPGRGRRQGHPRDRSAMTAEIDRAAARQALTLLTAPAGSSDDDALRMLASWAATRQTDVQVTPPRT